MPSPYGGSGECDPYAQDCADGERCVPWANDGGNNWNSTICSALVAMPDQLGDACTAENSGVSGVDSCDAGLMCFGVDAETNIGECIELCGCGPAQGTCTGEGTVCTITNGGELPICLPTCDPLLPAEESLCSDGFGCYLAGGNFQCAPDASGDLGAYGDPCEFINACDSGLACLGTASQPACGSDVGCCAPTCDLDEADNCPDDLECLPAFEEGMEPEACHEDTGFCVLPA